jgi:hypothetical protein
LLPEEYRLSADRVVAKPFRNADLVRLVNELAGIDHSKAAA